MYKNIGKDELIVIYIAIATALVYRLLQKYELIPDGVMLIIFILAVAYLFFNRTVKFIVLASKMKGDSYETYLTIEDITRVRLGRGSYDVFTGRYEDERHKEHVKDIHGAFSIRKWKVGDRIRIRVSVSDPENIIIVHSDAALAVFWTILGILIETALITVYVRYIMNAK